MSAAKANPLPEDGVVGRLTAEQTTSLKQFWRELFELVDNAPKQGKSSGPAQPTDPNAPRVSEKDTPPKDSAEKEKQRQHQEMADARAAFEQYGSARFRRTFWRFIAMDHPDSICLKFLRARKWAPTAGVAMFAACMKWRIESGVEDIFEKGEEGLQHQDGFLAQMTGGKTYLYGSDRYGRPVIYVNVALHKPSAQPAKSLEDFVLFQMESVRAFAHGSVDKVTMVFNMQGFSLSNMDYKVLTFLLKCLESYYPESLNAVLIHKAPWVFQGVWKIVAPMLDPVVRAKVHMTKGTEDLCVHIPPTHLASSLGGQNTWQWEYPPIVPGENRAMQDTATRDKLQGERDALAARFEDVSRRWMVASADDAETAGQRDLLAKELRAQYLALDPYVRGRGAYHRIGNIVGNGLVSFRYPGAHGTPEGEFEVLGHAGSKESIEIELARAHGHRKPAGTGAQPTASSASPTDGKANEAKTRSKDSQEDGSQAAREASPAPAPSTPRGENGPGSTANARGEEAAPYASNAVPGASSSQSSTSNLGAPASLGRSASSAHFPPASSPPLPSQNQTQTRTSSTPRSSKLSSSSASIASSLNGRGSSAASKLRRRFSSATTGSPGSILRLKGGNKKEVIGPDGSVQAAA